MNTDDARGVERPAALTALRRFAEVQAVTARSLGQEQTERGWLDALALLDQADKQAARLIEQREAAARAEGMARVTAYPEEVIEAAKAEGRREVREAVEGVCEEATERAYFAISLEEMLTIQCTGEGRAKVPPHWRVAAERRARISPADLRAVLAGQGGESGEGA